MSIEAMTLVLNHSKATGRAKLVLLGIANHQGDQGAWPSIETLARYANASERSVIRDINDLAESGELIVERNAAPVRGQYRPNLYWVNVAPGVTDFEAGVTKSTSGVTNSDLRGDTVVTLNNINLKENQVTLPQGELEAEFSEFWNIYPRKVEKIAARKAFDKAWGLAGEEVIKGARRLADDPNLPPKQFIPYPASWLNAGGWENEPYPERQLTPEERQAREKAEAEARRQSAIAHAAALRAESEEASKKATPPPKCVHGNSIVSCRICLRS